MGGKKKAAKNDFYFFMQDQKKQLRRENYVWNTMDELVQICSPRWKQVPDSDKQRYKEMAKNYKKVQQNDLANKFTCAGESMADTERDMRSREEKLRAMRAEIGQIVANANKSGSLSTSKFFFLHINPLVQLDEDTFLPCEMAVVEYSLQSGITRIFHSFIKPERIPVGFGYAIQVNNEDKHKLDPTLPPLSEKAASSWGYIVRCFCNFINPEGFDEPNPPLYTLEEDASKTESMLDLLFDWGMQRKRRDVRIYHIHELFGAMVKYLNAFGVGRSNLDVVAATKLESQEHDLSLDIACRYHDEVERPSFCSLTRVKSWAFVISESCCQCLQKAVEMKEGHHVPQKPPASYYAVSKPVRYEEEVLMSKWRPSHIPSEPTEFEVFSSRNKAEAAGVIPKHLSSGERTREMWLYSDCPSGGEGWAPGPSNQLPSADEFPALGNLSISEDRCAANADPVVGTSKLSWTPVVKDKTPEFHPDDFPALGS